MSTQIQTLIGCEIEITQYSWKNEHLELGTIGKSSKCDPLKRDNNNSSVIKKREDIFIKKFEDIFHFI